MRGRYISTRLVALSLLFALGVVLTSATSRAEPRLDGRWRQTALREDFTVQQWLDAGCGPPPQSTSTGGGEVVSVRMEGDELAFVGGGRVYRTNQCYDPMPTLQRGAHSRDASGKSWKTRCTTPPADPRKVVLNTLVVLTTEAHIDLIETGRYEITLESGRCMADVTRKRSFDLLPDDVTPAAPTATTPKAPAKDPVTPRPALCGVVGEAQTLEVRPSRKLLRTGESFRFRALVLDAKGCDTKTATTWKLAPDTDAKGVKVDASGNVTVAKDSTEGTVEIIASASGKDARVAVEVVSPARYDELLAHSGLNEAGENEEASTVTIASQSLGAGEGRVEDRSRQRRLVFLGIIGASLVAIAIAGALVMRRTRRAKALLEEAEERHEARVQEVLDRRKQREAEHAAQMRAHEESVARAQAQLVCPTCHREMTSDTAFCPHDGTPLASASASSASAGRGGICPVCNTAFGSEYTRCPKDKELLIPTPMPALLAPRAPVRLRGKICPVCGDRFDGGADFCGKDGTQLVLLN